MRLNLTSAAGAVALLEEEEEELKFFALTKLDSMVDVFWPEISESIQTIEMMYEDSIFKHRNLAALLASKVYYHLGAFEESLFYALGAKDLFNVSDTSEYTTTTISKCIDFYTKKMQANYSAKDDDKEQIDVRLEAIVNRMFQRCLDDKCYKQAIGIALETRRTDIFEQAIEQSGDIPENLSYCLKVCLSLIQSFHFRNTILKILVKMYLNLDQPDYVSVCQCFIFLDDPQAVADILSKLIKGDEDSILMGYQIGFDLYESATQQFLQSVQNSLRATAPIPETSKPTSELGTDTAAPMDTEEGETSEVTTTPSIKKLEELTDAEKDIQIKFDKLNSILGGEKTIDINLQFLIRNTKSDLLILRNTKEAVRNSVCHTATVIANAYMNCGTTSDQFLRDNLDWLGRATNYAKFTATASLGVIHKGHEKEALNLMSTYLPKDSSSSSAYSEGGGLYALGLIHANHGGDMTDYLLGQLKEATSHQVRHGGCLGLGLAAMGTARPDIYEILKQNLEQDDAVTGEAAGIGMGLVMLATKSSTAIRDMMSYAQDTQHEKILRGLALGIAMIMYGRLEEADTLIEQLSSDKDPILRWSGMYTLAMAYCGTSSNKAIKRLLHVAVSDVNDDVRRVAVTSLGFLLFRSPEQCPSVVSLLSESYNPHVRYGAAMALGIACAGTGLKDAIALLEPMTNDPINYVRQGALIASALILIQQNEITCPKVTFFRELYSKVISDKHDDVMAKFGAILALGIIDGGGRNMTISLQTRTGHTTMTSVVGLMVFQQFWYWFPLSHFLTLAFVPTYIVGLNDDLKMPKLEFISNAKPSTYAYPPPLEDKKEKTKEKVETAILSITAKQKKKEAEKKEAEKKKGDKEEKMEVDEEKKDDDKEINKDTKTTEEKIKDDKNENKKKEVEPQSMMLANPARVMRAQLRIMSMSSDSRYEPLKDVSAGGIIMLKNKKPDEEEDLIELVSAGGPKADEEDEPEPPEPFEWSED